MRSPYLFACLFVLFLMLAPVSHAFTLLYADPDTFYGWGTSTISFDIDYTNCPSREVVDGAVTSALDLWNGVPTANLKLVRGSEISTTVAAATSSSHAPGNPTIVCDPSFDSTIRDNVPAYASAFQTAGLRVAYAAMVLNASTGAANVASFDSTKFGIILAHEMGHILGLGHSADTSALMYYNATNKVNLTLAQDDVDGITFLYPRKEPGQGKLLGCASVSAASGGGRAKGGSSRDGGRDGDSGDGPLIAELALLLAVCAWVSRQLSKA